MRCIHHSADTDLTTACFCKEKHAQQAKPTPQINYIDYACVLPGVIFKTSTCFMSPKFQGKVENYEKQFLLSWCLSFGTPLCQTTCVSENRKKTLYFLRCLLMASFVCCYA